ncbi:MAG: vWA domain-containing protein [Geminicoccales bacterium]
MKQFNSCLTITALIVPLLISTASLAQDGNGTRVMLVLDGSSSMWTRVDGDVSKIEVAKETIGDLVDGWESKMHFGITTYGHRRESDCQDIETVLPVQEIDGAQVIEVVEEILPRGKTPLAGALRQAAERLDYESKAATILLVSDGMENCGQDPCKVAEELASKAKDLTIDIIGFDMNNHQMGQLECIATNTGGHVTRADVGDFGEAMDQSMTEIVDEAERTATLSLSTTLVGKPVTEDVRYVVYRSVDNVTSKVAESFSVAPTLTLSPGRFKIEALRGEGARTLSKSVEIELTEGATNEHVFKLAEFRPPIR